MSLNTLNQLSRESSDAYAAGQTEMVNNNNDNNDNNESINERSNEMFDFNRLISDMTRCIMLVGVAMFSTSIFSIILIIFAIFNWRRIYLFIFLLLDLIINVYVRSMLQFKMSRSLCELLLIDTNCN